MTLQEALRHGTRLLTQAGSDEASLEAELLLGHALRLDRVHLYQRLRDELTTAQTRRYGALLNRRLAHEPAAYIVGHKEFYGLDFEVTPAAIIPRPETELLVELALDFAGSWVRRVKGQGSRVRGQGSLRLRSGQARVRGDELRVADVGVGCGAIAVAIAREMPEAEIIATDISLEALDLARRNARRHGLARGIRFLQGDLLDPVDAPVDIIAANLPYVPSADLEAAPPEIRDHEPRQGLDGGPDGLRLIGRLLQQAPAHLKPNGVLFVEMGDEQGAAAARLAQRTLPEAHVRIEKDLSGLDRVLVVIP